MLEIGSPAPSISLLDDQGNQVSLSDYKGKYIVLYAYPRDDTPGCTAEACSFRDQSEAIGNLHAVVLGISADSVASHKKFKEKYQLGFPLLSDPDHELLEALGAWGEKVSYGKKSIGIIRSTYVFDQEGKLLKVWPKVSPQTHGEEIAAYLKGL
ncbi:MAG: peroxiredoxin [Sphaerochaetaceae bacterium]|nr:peroxiredoxin [Sphaerochaetaceae bacterium]